jgi:UDP-2-acetamido-2-deoxy-ribo-hexuluronate aminotransferase
MIPFIDLQAQRQRIADRIDAAVLEVVAGGRYILGPQVIEFEEKLAAFAGAKHCVSCANGTDALVLPLMAWGVGAGDAVFCPSFTFVATAEIVPCTGAVPVFVDIDRRTYNLDPEKLEAAIQQVKAEGRLTPKVVIAVDLFGQPADYPKIAEIARRHGLKLIADSAQGFGCTLGGEHPQRWADVTTTSFFPAKPLGAYGDGGAILTDDDALQDELVSLRVHGQASARDIEARAFAHEAKYLNVRIGLNSRLDTIQAAILLEKLAIFPDEIEARNRVAARYNELLAPHVEATPEMIEGGVSVWAQYTIEHRDRDGLAAHLKGAGVPTAVYYPIPIHRQPAYENFPAPGGLPASEDAAGKVISLPMHAYLDEATQDRIVEAVRGFDG